MADRCNTFLRSFAAIRAKRIGSHVDVRAGAVLIREPCAIARCERSLQCDDALLRRHGWALSPNAESNRFLAGEAASEEVGSDSIHRGYLCERESKGFS